MFILHSVVFFLPVKLFLWTDYFAACRFRYFYEVSVFYLVLTWKVETVDYLWCLKLLIFYIFVHWYLKEKIDCGKFKFITEIVISLIDGFGCNFRIKITQCYIFNNRNDRNSENVFLVSLVNWTWQVKESFGIFTQGVLLLCPYSSICTTVVAVFPCPNGNQHLCCHGNSFHLWSRTLGV